MLGRRAALTGFAALALLGTVAAVCLAATGKEHGAQATRYRSGALKEEGERVGGERQGRWRFFHPSGRLAEEANYQGGKLHGPRRRLFDDGKKALEARYEKGSPAGSWTAYYDNGRAAVSLTFPDGSGEWFLANGNPWPKGQKLASCEGRPTCTSLLDQMDLDSLPPVIPGACPQGGDKKGRVWTLGAAKPLLAGVGRTWRGGDKYSPVRCTDSVVVSCAPDIDGDGRDEVLAEISYRTPRSGEQSCGAKDRATTAVFAISPPASGGTEWTSKGLIGYPRFDNGNGIAAIDVTGFVRLPGGEVGVRVQNSFDGVGSDHECSSDILGLRGRRWEVLVSKAIVNCGELEKPKGVGSP